MFNKNGDTTPVMEPLAILTVSSFMAFFVVVWYEKKAGVEPALRPSFLCVRLNNTNDTLTIVTTLATSHSL